MDFDCKAVFAILVLRYFLTVPNAQAVLCTCHPKPKAGTAKAWLSMGCGHRSRAGGGPRDAGPHIYIYIYIYLQAPPAHIKIDGIDWMCNPEKYGVIGFYPNR